MLTTLRYTLSSLRGQILGWGLGVAALGLLLVPFYDVFMGQQADFLQMIESYPPEFLAFFGGDAASLATTEGYLGMYGFSMLPLIVGIFAVIAGSGLLASDEEAAAWTSSSPTRSAARALLGADAGLRGGEPGHPGPGLAGLFHPAGRLQPGRHLGTDGAALPAPAGPDPGLWRAGAAAEHAATRPPAGSPWAERAPGDRCWSWADAGGQPEPFPLTAGVGPGLRQPSIVKRSANSYVTPVSFGYIL
jgi:hypothetical protein